MECFERETGETHVRACIGIGQGSFKGATGYPFFDHMLETLARYSGLGIEVSVEVLKEIDDHHVIEDVGIAIGRAFDMLLGDRRGLARYGYSIIPMDDALVYTAVDLARRPYFNIRGYRFGARSIGGVSLENIPHFLRTLAYEGRFTLHVVVVSGFNSHHVTEAIFKSLGFSLRQAMERGESISTKGTLL